MTKFDKKSFLIILISPSAGGKSAILKRVLVDCDDIDYSISYTTRKPRINESNNVDYHFISESEFKELQTAGDLLESAFVHDCWYGTSHKFIENELQKGKHIIMDIDVQGAKQILQQNIEVVTIFIIPPDINVLTERLKERGTDSIKEIEIRLQTARKEMEEIGHFDYLVINDDLETAVSEVIDIIRVEEKKVKRFTNIKEIFYGG